MTEHASLIMSKLEETVVEPLVVVPSIDLSKVKEQANRITESLNALVSDVEAELDSIEQRVLELVAKRLEK